MAVELFDSTFVLFSVRVQHKGMVNMGVKDSKMGAKGQNGGRTAPPKTAAKRDAANASAVIDTARICGVSKRYVRFILTGERQNDEVFLTYCLISKGYSKLLNAVEKAVPFLPDERNPVTKVEVSIRKEYLEN